MICNILVVNDNQGDRSRMEKFLGAAGYQVSTAENSALAAVKRGKPDAIMIEVNTHPRRTVLPPPAHLDTLI